MDNHHHNIQLNNIKISTDKPLQGEDPKENLQVVPLFLITRTEENDLFNSSYTYIFIKHQI